MIRQTPLLSLFASLALLLGACSSQEPKPKEEAPPPAPAQAAEKKTPEETAVTQPKLEIPDREKWQLSEEEWKKRLTPEQFHVLRKSGTERACTGAYWEEKRVGVFFCAGCGLELFTSDTKYESGTGWPSFFQPVKASYVEQSVDHKLGYPRNEVHCGRCGGHLGHVFTDGPKPTGLRYCINSASLRFVPKEGQEAKTGAQAEAKTPEAQK